MIEAYKTFDEDVKQRRFFLSLGLEFNDVFSFVLRFCLLDDEIDDSGDLVDGNIEVNSGHERPGPLSGNHYAFRRTVVVK